MKKILFTIISLLILSLPNLQAIDGFFLGYKGGFLIKVDIASAFAGKRIIGRNESIYTGMGEYGATMPHGFPRILEGKAAPYVENIFFWGYKFPKVFSLGFGILLSNFVMPSLMFDFKFTLTEKYKVKPYLFADIYGGLLDGFPIGITGGGGIDIYFTDHLYMLLESKAGVEIFVARYYDDGINSNPIWHWDSVYAYGLFTIYIGVGYQFKNRNTDENGKWIKKSK